MDRRTISLIQFTTGRKVTFDESKFKVVESENDVYVVLVDDPDKVAMKCKWDNILYIRHGVIKRDNRQTKNVKSSLGEPSDVLPKEE